MNPSLGTPHRGASLRWKKSRDAMAAAEAEKEAAANAAKVGGAGFVLGFRV